jgi:hypothetical protein
MPAIPRAAPPTIPAETAERAKVRAMLMVIVISCVRWLLGPCAGLLLR